MTGCNLTDFARIKILVLPISPQKQSNFDNYFSVLSKFSSISLAELTPPDSKTGRIEILILAKYIDQLYHQGLIHYEFVTSYNRDLQQLEELELSRQILGVSIDKEADCFR